jgi:hypothetical protein
MAIAVPDSMLVSRDRPADAKSLYDSIADRNALPIPLRFKSMFVAVKNPIGQRATWWCLPTDDLSNAGWVEVRFDGSVTIVIDDWMPATPYLLKQPVVNDGKLYRAKIAHTSSADFETDEGNWELLGGVGGSSYTHTQDTANNTWTCNHLLNSIGVSVVVIDGDGDEVVGYVDRAASTPNALVIKFSVPITGRAYIKS